MSDDKLIEINNLIKRVIDEQWTLTNSNNFDAYVEIIANACNDGQWHLIDCIYGIGGLMRIIEARIDYHWS